MRETSQKQFSCIAHNFFDLDMLFLLKGIWLSVWLMQDLSIDGSGLPNINFDSLGSQIKFLNTMKYYSTSLGKLTSTLDSIGKKVRWKTLHLISKSTRLFLTNLAAWG